MEFMQAMENLIIELKTLNVPDSTIYILNEEEQGRIFQITEKEVIRDGELYMPTKGRFIATLIHPKAKLLVLGFCEFPEEGGHSVSRNLLAYSEKEYTKAAQHIQNWLGDAVIPEEDREHTTYDEAVLLGYTGTEEEWLAA